MYVYFRIDDEETVMVVLNKNKQETELNLARFAEVLKNVISGKNIMTGETVAMGDQLQIPGNSPLIISIKKWINILPSLLWNIAQMLYAC